MFILAFEEQFYKWGIWKQILFQCNGTFVDKIPKKENICNKVETSELKYFFGIRDAQFPFMSIYRYP